MGKRRYAIRQIRVEGDLAYIPLTQGLEAVIDAADVPLVEGVNWYAWRYRRNVYVRRNKPKPDGGCFYLHRVICGEEGLQIDHRDGNGLNNRRSNLRSATPVQNGYNCTIRSDNTSGLKGVTYERRRAKWKVQIQVDKKRLNVGEFSTREEAYEAFKSAAAQHHGEFARLG